MKLGNDINNRQVLDNAKAELTLEKLVDRLIDSAIESMGVK